MVSVLKEEATGEKISQNQEELRRLIWDKEDKSITMETHLDADQRSLDGWQEELEGLQRYRGAGDGLRKNLKLFKLAFFGFLLVLILVLAMVIYQLVL